MKRYHLFEFEDLPWFPDTLRQNMMDFLRFAISKLQIYEPIVPLLQEIVTRSGKDEILDLGSGGGGGIAGIQAQVSQAMQREINITLTDKYPNIPAFKLVKSQTKGAINYIPEPVDATAVPANIKSCRTIFSAFHHFKPQLAQAILADAAHKRVPIGIFEGATKSYLEILAALTLFPFIFLVVTPFIKPLRFSRFFFTYFIPLIPLCTMWDGSVSILRLYTPEHLLKLTQDINAPNYTWQAGRAKHKSGARVIYLIGYPV